MPIALSSFEVVTSCIWLFLGIFGMILYIIANKPLRRAEQQRREDEAYQQGYRRGYRAGLESEPQSITKLNQKEP